jgi:alkanesulfonate monooxygenase SsuD/methylene tetrahydromethanopterin reductase-like flavin-dependent oxidoreductase (luciferase family)
VRLGVVLRAEEGPDPLASLTCQAASAEASGLAMVVVEVGSAVESPLLAAGALAANTRGLRLVVIEAVGRHPIGLAEDAVVVDNLSGGRLVLVLAGADEAELAESAHVLALALRGRPFRHRGVRWTIPAQLETNAHEETRIVVTPPPAQLRLPLWLAGAAAVDVGCTHRLPPLLEHPSGDTARAAWDRFDAAHDAGDDFASRPILIELAVDRDGRFEADDLIDLMRDHAGAWDMDTALIRFPASANDEARIAAIRHLGTHVRPRILQDRLPEGLQAHWDEHLADQLAAIADEGPR